MGRAVTALELLAYDALDLASALYWYCADYHGGQWSDEYAVLSWVSDFYQPGACEHGVVDPAQDIYAALVARQTDPRSVQGALMVKLHPGQP